MVAWSCAQRLYAAVPVLLLYGGLACAQTWPLIRRLSTHLPIGMESSPTVALFNLWTLRWNAHQFWSGYPDYWQAPIFFPTPGAFALSEAQPLTGGVFALLAALSGSDIASYNLVLLLCLALNGLAGASLAITLGLARGPALLAGILAQSLPFVSNELGVLQLTMVFPLLWALAALVAFARNPGLLPALALTLSLVAAVLTCTYYGLLLLPFLLLATIVFLRREMLRLRVLAALLLAAGLALLLALAVLLPQSHYLAGFTRSSTTIQANSARLGAYLRLSAEMWGSDVTPWLASNAPAAHRLYPGTGLLLLAALGLPFAWRTCQRRWLVFCLAGSLLALGLSLGLNLTLGTWQPYTLLRDYLPGFRQLRSPFRFGLLVQLFLLGLAGFGLAGIWQQARLGVRLLVVALVVLSVSEVLVLPARLYPIAQAQQPAPWVGWLTRQEPGAVALVPFPRRGYPRDYLPTVIGMLQLQGSRRPLVNGYSGFFPQPYLRLRAAMRGFPDAGSINRLDAAGVTYLVIDQSWLTAPRRSRLNGWSGRLVALYQDSQVVVYRLRSPW